MSTGEIVDRLLRPSAFNLIAPILPGGVLVLGLFLLRTSAAPQVIGGVPQSAIAVFLAYVAGLVLYTVTGTGTGLLAYWLGSRVGTAMPPTDGLEPWKDQQWRRVARQFIGDALSPALDEPAPPDVLKLQVENLKLMNPDPGEQSRRIRELTATQLDRQTADFQWFGWYQALAVWFPRPYPAGFTEYPFAAVVHAVVVAVIALLAVARSNDWRPWVGCLVIFLITMLYELVQAMNYIHDATGRYYQMAGMLRDLRDRSTTGGLGRAPGAPTTQP